METDRVKIAVRKTRQLIEASVVGVISAKERIVRSQKMIDQTIAKLNRRSHAKPITVQTDHRPSVRGLRASELRDGAVP